MSSGWRDVGRGDRGEQGGMIGLGVALQDSGQLPRLVEHGGMAGVHFDELQRAEALRHSDLSFRRGELVFLEDDVGDGASRIKVTEGDAPLEQPGGHGLEEANGLVDLFFRHAAAQVVHDQVLLYFEAFATDAV